MEDTAIASLQFERGTCATLAVTHAAIESRDTLRIFGSSGSIHVETLNKGDVRTVAGGQERREAHPPAANLHQPLIDDFVQAVLTGREPAVNGGIGRAVAAVEAEIYDRCA